ncbi:ABC transporter permease [Salipiger sp.]|uniref:ABC transporter permease n=1 Tax=Salipiger sp. TaxID=2078585 RepID=UPI003A97F01A
MSRTDSNPTVPPSRSDARRLVRLLLRDPAPLLAVCVLLVIVFSALFGPLLVGEATTKPNFALRNAAPQLEHGLAYILGADNLGRSVLGRLVLGARTTISIAAGAVVLSLTIGGALGLLAGSRAGLLSDVIMRLTDIIMAFPSLLIALIVLYLLGPGIGNLVLVLAVTRIPIYLRTVRAEVMEIRRRPFVAAARSMGAGQGWIMRKHLIPLVLPTLFTIAAVDFAAVIIAESGLSFLGLGVQPPDFTWGSMVAAGRGYISSAWWLAALPGAMILATTLSLAVLSNWVRLATDPAQAWRFFRASKGSTI